MAQVKVITKKIPVRRSTLGSDATFEDTSTNNGILQYTVMSGASDVKNFRDGDNFYPFDGEIDAFQNEIFPEKDEFSYSNGLFGGFFSPEESRKRRESRYARRNAKTQETLSRADLNKNLGKEKQSDVELAKALQDSGDTKGGLSTGTIVGIAVGGLVVIGLIVFAIKRKKK